MNASSLNPWLTIWFQPRRTIRFLLDRHAGKWFYLLAIAGAFTHIAGNGGFWFNSVGWSVLMWVVLSVVIGLSVLYIFGGFLKWTGSWLKGKGSLEEVMTAIGWSQIPVICFFVLETILFLVTGGRIVGIVYSSFVFACSLWSFFIFLCCLAEAHQFSFFKALINWLMATVILFVIFIVINVLITVFSGGMSQTNWQSAGALLLRKF